MRHPLPDGLAAMCVWCTSAATCRVDVPTPELERRTGHQRKAHACDRHALLVELKGDDL